MLIFQQVTTIRDLQFVLNAIELSLKKGRLSYTSVGKIFVLDELCVDIHKDGKLIKMVSYKA